ncbi:hypothetical protein BW900_25860 [Bacillus mycoides]|uniref:Uncharacterized protein n=1 Tax=Bacillus mycoides TaxID=1405 RepID=A0A1S9T1A4_BACMY|nr:hypothetical protein BW900_25860 [Bacillus mycoides]
MDNIDKLRKNQNNIVTVHRFYASENTDQIYVLNQSKLIDSGDHNQLLGINLCYLTLVKKYI